MKPQDITRLPYNKTAVNSYIKSYLEKLMSVHFLPSNVLRFTPTWPPANEREGNGWAKQGRRDPDPERRWKRISMKWKIRYHNVNLIQNQLMKEMNCDSHLPGPTAKREGMMEDGGWRGGGRQWMNKARMTRSRSWEKVKPYINEKERYHNVTPEFKTSQ